MESQRRHRKRRVAALGALQKEPAPKAIDWSNSAITSGAWRAS